jgi:REP element-mobilizing transposase RayT
LRSGLVMAHFVAKPDLNNTPSMTSPERKRRSSPARRLRSGLVGRNEIMAPPLGYLITWTTYGSWLPGDERGWVEFDVSGIQAGDLVRQAAARARMREEPVLLDAAQRALVESTIRDHCALRQWQLHAVNARSNHVHVVVTAQIPPEQVVNQFKAWCSRRLSEQFGSRKRWWTHYGSTKWINEESYLHNAIRYVLERQG